MWNSSLSDIPYFLTAYQLSYSRIDSKENFLSSAAHGMWRWLCTIPTPGGVLSCLPEEKQMIHIASLVSDSLESLNQGESSSADGVGNCSDF